MEGVETPIGECVICMEERIALFKWPNDACIHMFCQFCTRQIKIAQNTCPICIRPPQPPNAPPPAPLERMRDIVARDFHVAFGLPQPIVEFIINLASVFFTIVVVLVNIAWRILKTLLLCLVAIATFVQNNSPFQWVLWTFCLYFILVAMPVLLCRSHDLPEILNYYDANNTIVFSRNMSIVKQGLTYVRYHSIPLENFCNLLIKT